MKYKHANSTLQEWFVSSPCAKVCNACSCKNAPWFRETCWLPSRSDIFSSLSGWISIMKTTVPFHSEDAALACVGERASHSYFTRCVVSSLLSRPHMAKLKPSKCIVFYKRETSPWRADNLTIFKGCSLLAETIVHFYSHHISIQVRDWEKNFI